MEAPKKYGSVDENVGFSQISCTTGGLYFLKMNSGENGVRTPEGWLWGEFVEAGDVSFDPGELPRISIVTPSFNQGDFIEETIRSVLLQNYPNLEYIVMDGGSTDDSVAIIRKYERWITHWESAPDRGQSHAINKGFARSTGEILGWLNSDDALAPGALGRVGEVVGRRSSSLVVGDSILTDDSHSLEGRLDRRQPSWKEMAYDARTFPQPSVFFTRDLWEAAGPLDEDLYFAMDYRLWLRMRRVCENEIFIEEILSFARCHENQKGAVARATGRLREFTKQRAVTAVRAAKERGEWIPAYLLRSWTRRWVEAFRRRNFSMLKGSEFHRAIVRAGIDAHFARRGPSDAAFS